MTLIVTFFHLSHSFIHSFMETSQNVKCLRVILHGITGDYFSLLFCNIKMIYKAHVSPLSNGLKF